MKRKKWLMVLGTVLVLFLAIDVLPVLSQTAEPEPPAGGDLVVLLELTDEQAARLEKIVNMAKSQAKKDREAFKGNALGLIQAARRTREMSDSHISALLNPEQGPLFNEFKKRRRRNEEFFLLNEGLLLTEEQRIRVADILGEFRRKSAAGRGQLKGRGGGMGDGVMDGGMHGRGSGGMRGGGRGGMRGGGRGGMRGGGDSMMISAMKQWDTKKAKKIKTLLTKEQKEMYKDIRKMQKAEMKKRMEEMRQKMRTNTNR